MSFLLDPPALFVIGFVLYYAGKKLGLERLAKITIGLIIVVSFILFSVLLYAEIFRCVFPVICRTMSGSEFMFHSDITGIYKKDVPLLVVILLFAIYPVWIYLGYALALMLSKHRKVPKEVYYYKDVKSRRKIEETKYSVMRHPDVHQAVRPAVDALGGMQSFVKEGDKVLIKINICGGTPELIATYTTKEVAGEVVDMVREVGGKPILCDADMIWTKFWPNAKAEGWIEWAKQKGVKLVNLSETEIVNFDFGDEGMMPKELVSKEMLDADVIISIPAMKTHLMTDVTLGMKNMYGTFPEIDKARYHKLGIDEVIYWVNYAFTPNLTIIDGSIGGEIIGPLSCDAVDFNTIIASNSVVTADSIAAQLMGFDNPQEEIDHINLAHERGLGNAAVKFDFNTLPYQHPSDGRWRHSDLQVARFYTWGVHLLLKIPGWDTLFNIGSDFFLYDAARLPLLKYFTPAFLLIANDIAKWSLGKKPTPESKNREKMNLTIYLIFALLSIFSFVSGGFFAKSSFDFMLSFMIVLVFAAWFATRMKTAHLLVIWLSSVLIASLVEHFPVLAGMWRYIDGGAPPLFSLFAISIFAITIIGISHFLRRAFAYVGLDGMKFRNVPFTLIMLAFVAFLFLEGYLAIVTLQIVVMYISFSNPWNFL
jgi:uncharacterized protein (DUF362 family)